MAKGWSFSALVAALKTAAFRDVGSADGNVIEVAGFMGFGKQTVPVIANFDWNNYNFVAGQMIAIDTATMLNAPDFSFATGEIFGAIMVGANNSLGGRVLFMFPTSTTGTCPYHVTVTGATGARTFQVSPLLINEPDVGSINITTLLNQRRHVGDYTQPNAANATTARGYPVAAAGVLSVRISENTVMQIYRTSVGEQYQRNTTNAAGTTWTPWSEFLNSKSRKTAELSSIELYGSTPYIDFHFGSTTNDFDTRIINDVSGRLNINGNAMGPTTLYQGNGVFIGKSKSGAWAIESGDSNAASFRVSSSAVPLGSWTPMLTTTQSISSGSQPFGTGISYGALTPITADWTSPAILAQKGSTRMAWIFNANDGRIYVDKQGTSDAIWTRTDLDTIYPSKDGIKNIGLEADNPDAPYMRRQSNNAMIYLATKQNVSAIMDRVDAEFVRSDNCGYAGFVNGDVNIPYLRHKTANTVVNLARVDWAANTFISDYRTQGVGVMDIVTNVQALVPSGCVMVGWLAQSTDKLYYSQMQKYIPGLGWLNIGRV